MFNVGKMITNLVARIVLAFLQVNWRVVNQEIIKIKENYKGDADEYFLIFNWMSVHVYVEYVGGWWIKVLMGDGTPLRAKLGIGQYLFNKSVADRLFVEMHRVIGSDEERDKDYLRLKLSEMLKQIEFEDFTVMERVRGITREVSIDLPFDDLAALLLFKFHGKRTVTGKYDGFLYVGINYPVSDSIIYQTFQNWVGEDSIKINKTIEDGIPSLIETTLGYIKRVTTKVRNA